MTSQLTDEQVRSVGQGVLSHTWLQPMAAELLALRARVAELEAAQQAPLGYVVLAKRPSRSRPGGFEYAPAGSVWPDLDPVENHQGWCADSAEADPERFGDVEYVIAELRERGVGE